MKRLMDVVIAGVGIVLLSPIIAIVAIVVRIAMGPPVLFRQIRPGLAGRPFELLKFRTMTHEVDANGAPLADADRLTKLGGVLRSTSLDELPQLWNVLRGDMSLVGPRPLLMEYLPLFTREQARRHEAKPGLTGWAQVNGRNELSWDRKFELDVWYVDHASLLLDLRILGLTVVRSLRGDGISQAGHATAEKFRGSQH